MRLSIRRLIQRATALSMAAEELEPADEGVRNFIGKVPAVAGVEEVTGRLIRTGGGIADGLHRERPGWMRLGVMPDPAEEAPILILARQGC